MADMADPVLITKKIAEDTSPYPFLKYIKVEPNDWLYPRAWGFYLYYWKEKIIIDKYAYRDVDGIRNEPLLKTLHVSRMGGWTCQEHTLYYLLIIMKYLHPEIVLKILDTMLQSIFLFYNNNKFIYSFFY